MERKELYKVIKNRNAYMLFRNLEVELSSARLDGTNMHRSKSLLTALESMVNLYKMGDFPITETMADYKIRDKELFEISFERILEAVNNYGVKI